MTPPDRDAADVDRFRIYAAAVVRATAAGLCGVALGLHLAQLRLSAGDAALVVGAGLWGNAVQTAVVAWRGQRLGLVRTQRGLAMLLAAGGLMLPWSRPLAVLVAVAFVGGINGMGRDRGAALAVDAALLPATVPAAARTRAFAIHSVCQDVGHALGALLAGFLVAGFPAPAGVPDPVLTQPSGTLVPTWLVYAALQACTLGAYAGMRGAEAPGPTGPPLLAQSRRILLRVASLFLLDSLGSGFLTTAFLADWFHRRFDTGPEALGILFALARTANAASHLGAAWLARRIGLLNTMVLTHAPSSVLLLSLTWADSFPVAAALFLLREGLVEMDVPTRQSFVMAVVRPEERALVSGVTNLVRMAGWALAPTVAGVFLRWLPLETCLWLGAGIKLGYDGLLFVACRGVAKGLR